MPMAYWWVSNDSNHLTKMRFLVGPALLLLMACQSAPKGIKVAVAANLLLPLEEIVLSYEQAHKEKVLLIPGASGSLTAQIEKGAPFDLFLSANERFAKHLSQNGFTKGPSLRFLQGELLLWRKDKLDPFHAESKLDPKVKVAIADPQLAPYGLAAKQYLESLGIWESIQPNIVIGKSVGQVNQYLVSGVVDYAFTAPSARSVETFEISGQWQDIQLETPLLHPFVLLAKAHPEADQFLQYLQGEEAMAIFLKHGYSLNP